MAEARQQSKSRFARAEAGSAVFGALARGLLAGCALVVFGTAPAQAQSVGPQLGDPKRCVAVLEEMGSVGFRISDAQVVADAVLTSMRKRVGHDAAHYAGVAASAAAMKKLLQTPEGAGPQESQLAFFKGCEDAAPWRLRARFGTDKKGEKNHWVTLSCRKKGADPDPKKRELVEEKRFEGKTFLEARDALVAALPTFCPAIVGAVQIPLEGATATEAPADAGPPGMSKKKEPKAWTPPPRRD